MKANEQTLQQVERAIRKVADKFPPVEEPTVLTDIHLRVNQETVARCWLSMTTMWKSLVVW